MTDEDKDMEDKGRVELEKGRVLLASFRDELKQVQGELEILAED